MIICKIFLSLRNQDVSIPASLECHLLALITKVTMVTDSEFWVKWFKHMSFENAIHSILQFLGNDDLDINTYFDVIFSIPNDSSSFVKKTAYWQYA